MTSFVGSREAVVTLSETARPIHSENEHVAAGCCYRYQRHVCKLDRSSKSTSYDISTTGIHTYSRVA